VSEDVGGVDKGCSNARRGPRGVRSGAGWAGSGADEAGRAGGVVKGTGWMGRGVRGAWRGTGGAGGGGTAGDFAGGFDVGAEAGELLVGGEEDVGGVEDRESDGFGEHGGACSGLKQRVRRRGFARREC